MDWASITLAALREHRPDLLTTIETAAATTAAAAERDRLREIDEISAEGHEDIVAAAKADGTMTAATLALAILKAEKAAGKTLLAARADADASAQVPVIAPAASTTLTTGPIEDRAKAEWDKDADVRAEFRDSFANYLAYRKAEESGAARIKRAG